MRFPTVLLLACLLGGCKLGREPVPDTRGATNGVLAYELADLARGIALAAGGLTALRKRRVRPAPARYGGGS